MAHSTVLADLLPHQVTVWPWPLIVSRAAHPGSELFTLAW